MDDKLKAALDRDEIDAALVIIYAEDAPARVLSTFHEAIRYAYWERKNIDAVAALGRFALDYGNAISANGLPALKPIAYDIASFCWPGWDEPGITIDTDTQILGAEAAALNFLLAQRLSRPDAPLAAGHWIVGAHALAAGDRESALASFEEAAALVKRSKTTALEMLYEGYAAIAKREVFDTEELSRFDDGPELVAQLETAARLFG